METCTVTTIPKITSPSSGYLCESEATESLESFSSSDSSKNVPYVSMGGCCQKNKNIAECSYSSKYNKQYEKCLQDWKDFTYGQTCNRTNLEDVQEKYKIKDQISRMPIFYPYAAAFYPYPCFTEANFECCEGNELTESLSDVRKAHEKQKCFFNKLNVSPQLKFDDKSEKNDNISVSHKKLGISYSNYSISSNESAEKTTEFNKNSSNKVPSQLNIKENFSNISRKSMSNENLTCLSNFSGNIKEYEAYVGFKKKHVYNCESKLENDAKSLSSCEHQSVSNLSSSQALESIGKDLKTPLKKKVKPKKTLKQIKERRKEFQSFPELFKAKEKYEDAIEQTGKAREALDKTTELIQTIKREQGALTKSQQKKLNEAKRMYSDEYKKYIKSKSNFEALLKKHSLGQCISDVSLPEVKELQDKFKPKPKKISCGTAEILKQLQKDFEKLVDHLPLDALVRMTNIIDENEPDDVPGEKTDGLKDYAEVDKSIGEIAPVNKSKKKKYKKEHFFWENKKRITSSEKKENEKKSRQNYIKKVTENLLKGPSELKNSGGKKTKPVPKELILITNRSLNERGKVQKHVCLRTNKPAVNGSRGTQKYSPANEGRRDFREVIGVDQLKILLPLLAELGHAQNKRLKELELYKAVKECGIADENDFTLKQARMLCIEWKQIRKIEIDEFVFAIKYPSRYLEILSSNDLLTLEKEVKNFHTLKISSDAKELSKMKKRSLFDFPKQLNNLESSAGYSINNLFKKNARCTSPIRSAKISSLQRPKTAPSTRKLDNSSKTKTNNGVFFKSKSSELENLSEKSSRPYSRCQVSTTNTVYEKLKPYISKEFQKSHSIHKFTKTNPSSTFSGISSKESFKKNFFKEVWNEKSSNKTEHNSFLSSRSKNSLSPLGSSCCKSKELQKKLGKNFDRKNIDCQESYLKSKEETAILSTIGTSMTSLPSASSLSCSDSSSLSTSLDSKTCLRSRVSEKKKGSQVVIEKKQAVEKRNNKLQVAPILQNYRPPEPKMLPNMRRKFKEQKLKGMSHFEADLLKYNSDYFKKSSDISLTKNINNKKFVAWA